MYLYDFMLTVYHSLKMWFCTRQRGPLEHDTNLSNVKNVNNQLFIIKRKIHKNACLCHFRQKTPFSTRK